MIKVFEEEYVIDDIAYQIYKVTLFGIILFKKETKTTNIEIVSRLTVKKHTKIKGFKNETKN